MHVETYECHETAEESPEESSEAIGLLESLGCEGQLNRLSKSGSERSPYREMTADERFAYEVICPVAVKLESYDRSPIPLRVLQLASHVVSLGICDRLEVWDKSSAVEKDPVLVGVIKDGFREKFLILARWGDELEAFAVLLQRALKIRRESLSQSLLAIAAKATYQANDVSTMTDSQLIAGGGKNNPSYFFSL